MNSSQTFLDLERQALPSDYQQLYKATIEGDWTSAKQIFEEHKTATTAGINLRGDTALHIAVLTGKTHEEFVKNLVELTSPSDLVVKNFWGHTALVNAASVGNIEAAKSLVKKNYRLLYIASSDNYLPIHAAAAAGQRGMVDYLRERSALRMNVAGCRDFWDQTHPYAGEMGGRYLLDLISCEFYDIALELVKEYPKLVTAQVYGDSSPLKLMAKKASAFPSGIMHLNFWERLLYSESWKHLPNEDMENNNGNSTPEPQSPSDWTHLLVGSSFIPGFKRIRFGLINLMRDEPKSYDFNVAQLFHTVSPARWISPIWKGNGYLVKHIKHRKSVHKQALELVRELCQKLSKSTLPKDMLIRILEEAVEEATIRDSTDVITEILKIWPEAIWINQQGLNIFQMAVKNRSESVFSKITDLPEEIGGFLLAHIDEQKNTILHIAGQLSPPHKLNHVSGAALQMQRELEWFKKVDSLVKPRTRESLNSSGKTPAMVFSEAHADLVKAGEKWMKDTANSCTIIAALIVTVVFAAAITVPGGQNDNDGLPILQGQRAFQIFFVSNGVSLFASSTSLMLFMSILTARFAEQDFSFTLPNRLILGLANLFLSTACMMIAFGAVVYTMFCQGKKWSLIPIAASGVLPVTTFVTHQFPLLIDLCSSTYGLGIFRNKVKRPFYTLHDRRTCHEN